jgi:hypothetical protein
MNDRSNLKTCVLCGEPWLHTHVCKTDASYRPDPTVFPGPLPVIDAEFFDKGIGDIHSQAKGSGARFNTGKPDFSLVPLRLVASTYGYGGGPTEPAVRALLQLGQWQETGDKIHLEQALEHLGADGWSECAEVFEYGKRKYAAWNWAKGMAWSVPLACAARHLIAMIDGQATDDESGKPHRGHVFCNITMLLTYARTYPEGNDMPAKGLLA